MTLWMVRAGKHGETEDYALDNNVAAIGWEELPDLSNITAREELTDLLARIYPEARPNARRNWESQIWPFVRVMQPGDLVAMPLKARAAIALGRVNGPYRHEPSGRGPRHLRPVEWLEIKPRTAFDSDLLYSLGASLTVCRISRNNAEARITAMLEGTPQPAPSGERPPAMGADDPAPIADIEELAANAIRDYIGRRFRGHGLAELVDHILQAQGYRTRLSPEGPDGGVDILAGRGPLGFESPRLAVQVKSGDAPADVKVLRELQGVMEGFGAEYGLFVSWGGFRSSVRREAARLHFRIRLWGSSDIVREVEEYYDHLPETLRAELPLKRIWTIADTE